MMDLCDKNEQSWIGWLYKPFCCFDGNYDNMK